MSTIVPYQTFRAADADLMIAAGNDNLFAKLCTAIERPDLATDERFSTNGKRVRNREILVPLLDAVLATATAADWCDRLGKVGVPASPLQDAAVVVACEQTAALKILRRIGDSTEPAVALPISFNGVRPLPRGPAPKLGADTQRILRQGEFRA